MIGLQQEVPSSIGDGPDSLGICHDYTPGPIPSTDKRRARVGSVGI